MCRLPALAVLCIPYIIRDTVDRIVNCIRNGLIQLAEVLGINRILDGSSDILPESLPIPVNHLVILSSSFLLFLLYQAASAAASPKYVKLHFFLKIFIFHKIIVAVFVYMFYC